MAAAAWEAEKNIYAAAKRVAGEIKEDELRDVLAMFVEADVRLARRKAREDAARLDPRRPRPDPSLVRESIDEQQAAATTSYTDLLAIIVDVPQGNDRPDAQVAIGHLNGTQCAFLAQRHAALSRRHEGVALRFRALEQLARRYGSVAGASATEVMEAWSNAKT